MGWVWVDDDGEERHQKSSSPGGDISNPNYQSSSLPSDLGEVCSTRRTVRSQCRTEEVEPGKFLRKCEKTEEVLRDCLGKPVEVLQSNKEYTEEDVTEQIARGEYLPPDNFGADGGSAFNFPGLRNDMEEIERRFFGGINRFFQAAEEMRNGLFDVFGDFQNGGNSPSIRRGIPIEGGRPQMETSSKPKEPKNGDIDPSGLAKDI